jgi:beta-lactamase class A
MITVVYLVIILFGIGSFVLVYIYQFVLTSKLSIVLKFFFVLFLTLILMTVVYFREKSLSKDSFESKVLTPIAAPINTGVKAIHYVTKVRGLENVIKPVIQDEQGTYAVGIKNFKTGEDYFLNENKSFEPASLYKLWVMAAVFKKIGDGNLTLDKKLSADVKNINTMFKIDEENAELKEGVVSNTVEGALNKMITISDNYSAMLLGANVRFSNVNSLLAANGLTNSKLGNPPKTNVTDIVSYYEKLYNKQLVSVEASDQMLTILKQQTLNDRIPKYLPEDTVVAHKTGELNGVKHDAGIVFSQKGDYIIVLMSETGNLTHAAEIEANISKKVWEYFNR